MAYGLRYRARYTNGKNEDIVILFNQRDFTGGLEQEYEVVSETVRADATEDRFIPIIGRNMEIQLRVGENDPDLLDDLLLSDGKEWEVIATSDTQIYFHGFVLPDEGSVEFQDKPYIVTITATDGIGLLKDISLIQPDGSEFRRDDLIIWYIAAALQQTGLTLPIRVFDDVYHRSFLTRQDDLKYDFFGQTKLNYRTFQKDAQTFTDCYNTLEIILSQGYRLFQQKGEWFIIRLGLLQYVPFSLYYTLYDYNGANAQGVETIDNYASVGKSEMIFPRDRDQIKSSKPALKSTQTTFNYEVWPELPKNNKFERGDIIEEGTAYDEDDEDEDDDTTEVFGIYKKLSISDWTYGQWSGFPSQIAQLPALSATTAKAYRRSVYNLFGVEAKREIILEEVTGAIRGILMSDGIPVIKADKIKISFDRKLSIGGNGTSQIAMIFIIGNSGKKYNIESQNTSQMTPFFWKENSSGTLISRVFDSGESFSDYTSFSIEPPPFPEDGTLYIGLITQGILGSKSYFKNFEVEYNLYVANGYLPVTGDYWKRSQDKSYPDVSDSEIFISDNEHKVIKGCLLDANGVPLSADFYRDGLNESRRYVEICNLERFNQEYRRFWHIEGTFSGLRYTPQNDPTNFQPISLHKQYRFMDLPVNDRYFMIVPPLEMNMIKGTIRANFYEVSMNAVTTQKVESISHLISRIIAAINATSEIEWNDHGFAPLPGTTGFPPQATDELFYPSPRSLRTALDTAHQFIASSNVAQLYGAVNSSLYQQVFQLPEIIHIGDVFTFTAYEHIVTVIAEAISVTNQQDGIQEGTAEYKYIFE